MRCLLPDSSSCVTRAGLWDAGDGPYLARRKWVSPDRDFSAASWRCVSPPGMRGCLGPEGPDRGLRAGRPGVCSWLAAEARDSGRGVGGVSLNTCRSDLPTGLSSQVPLLREMSKKRT